jgi:dsRNA-specific ribonuclease
MVCCIQDQIFSGEGKSKKEAKLSCSQSAIEAICGAKITETKHMPEKSNPRASCDLDDWMEVEGKNPVSILNELYPGIQYQLCSTSGPSHAPQFVIKASLNDMSFEGSGKSKKDAKLNASKALLVHLHKVGFDPMTGDMMSTQEDQKDIATGHSFADQVGQLVTAKYQSLFGSTTYSKRTKTLGEERNLFLKKEILFTN